MTKPLAERDDVEEMSNRAIIEETLEILRLLEPLSELAGLAASMKENPMFAAMMGE